MTKVNTDQVEHSSDYSSNNPISHDWLDQNHLVLSDDLSLLYLFAKTENMLKQIWEYLGQVEKKVHFTLFLSHFFWLDSITVEHTNN